MLLQFGVIAAERHQFSVIAVLDDAALLHDDDAVGHVSDNGKVVGDIYCTERLELAEHAEIDGDVYYNLIEMAVGCRLNGGLRHVSAATDDLAAARQARHAELGEAQ